MPKSTFTQSEISAARRVYKRWKVSNFQRFERFLTAEEKKGFADSVDPDVLEKNVKSENKKP